MASRSWERMKQNMINHSRKYEGTRHWTGSAPIRPPASNTLLRKYLPRLAPLTIRQSAARYWVQRSEQGLVPGSVRPQATLAKGAAIGAASGGALAIIGNADGAPFAQESLQQQYYIMYGQCMAAHGNSVASFSPPQGTDLASGGTSLEICRPGGVVVWRRLDSGTFAFRTALADGLVLAAAMSAAILKDSGFDLTTALRQVFADGLAVGFVISLERNPG
jgi:hypothetical protein